MKNPILESNLRIINELKLFISLVSSNPELLKKFSLKENGFTRNRKLPFQELVLLISRLCKKTLSVELEDFFHELGALPCSVSAFSQSRSKLCPLFFYYWNQVLIKSYYHYHKTIKRWRGYRLIAVDGSSLNLFNDKNLTGYFGGQGNQSSFFTMAKTFYSYDILNELLVFSQIQSYRISELTMAYKYIDTTQEDMLLIYDRYFCNYKMMALHQWQEKERKYIIRGNEQHKFVAGFIKSKKRSAVMDLYPSLKTIENLKKSGYIITRSEKLKVRLIRVDLGNKIEVLVTNLWQEEGYDESCFKALYFKRWAIETNISLQKNNLQLESFSGLSHIAVAQDFYATILMSNLQAILIKDAQQSVESTIRSCRKHQMKINKNKAIGKIRKNFINLFRRRKVKSILKCLHDHFIKDLIPIRNGRSFIRCIKNTRNHSKYRTFNNFKPAF